MHGGGGDERLVVPKPDGVGHRSIPLLEQILKLIRLKKIGNRLIAAVLGQAFTLPTLVADLLPLHRLHYNLFRRLGARRRETGHHRRNYHRNREIDIDIRRHCEKGGGMESKMNGNGGCRMGLRVALINEGESDMGLVDERIVTYSRRFLFLCGWRINFNFN